MRIRNTIDITNGDHSWYIKNVRHIRIVINAGRYNRIFTGQGVIKKIIIADLLKSQFRKPRQMLGDQKYDGHLSIHDDKMAEDLGFPGAPIEGPTHFSQFVPLLHRVFGDDWFVKGCITAHYQNMVVEGEEVQTVVEKTPDSLGMVAIYAQKQEKTLSQKLVLK